MREGIDRIKLDNEQFCAEEVAGVSADIKVASDAFTFFSPHPGFSLSFSVSLSSTLSFSSLTLFTKPFDCVDSFASRGSSRSISAPSTEIPYPQRHRSKRLNPFFSSNSHSLSNEVENPAFAHHARFTRLLRTARGEETIWGSGCCDYHPARSRSRVHRWS